MRVAVIGIGYVGLPTTILLARAGHDVLAVDTDARVVRSLQQGRVHTQAEGLQALLDDPAIRARIVVAAAPEPCDAFLLAVPTPVDESGRAADLSMVRAAAEGIAGCVRPGGLVVVESTVPPGTCARVVRPILESAGLRVPDEVRLAHAPERVFPGDVLREIVENERIVGGIDVASTTAAADLYRTFVRGQVHETDATTAELTKLLENTYRDVNIAFANEVANLAAEHGVDPFEAITLANRHPRVEILSPGIGVGGHCIPVDPWFLVGDSPDAARLVPAARGVNDDVPRRVADRILQEVGPAEPILLLGATYKHEVSDTRGSPALAIAEILRECGSSPVTHLDPHSPDHRYGDLAEAARGAGVLAVLVPHRRILDDLARQDEAIRAAMAHPCILLPRDLIAGSGGYGASRAPASRGVRNGDIPH